MKLAATHFSLLWPALWFSFLPFAHGQISSGTNSPAHQAALQFMRGVNLGNYLEYAAGHGARNASYSAQDFTLIRAEGFDHVRIPVAWHLYAGAAPNYTISSTIFTQVDFMLNQARHAGLAALINLHHFDPFNANPTSNRDKFYAIWRQVATRYANASGILAFELLNEPNGAATTTLLNPIYTEAIRQIRQISPDRTIFVGPGQYNSIDELSRLSLPATDRNLIVTVHIYDPYYFTHQGAEWALPDTGTTGVIFPGPPPQPLKVSPGIDPSHTWVLDWFRDYNTKPATLNPSSPFAFRTKLSRARSYAATSGRPVHVGEFGCYTKSVDATSRVNFHREIRRTLDEFELGWAMWDWKSGFHYIKNGLPDPPELRAAMFPPISMQMTSPGAIEFTAAKGKTFVVERSASLAEPVSWTMVSTQILSSSKFRFEDLNAERQATSFYRVRWLK